LWEAKDLAFTDATIGPMRVVLAEEQWRQARRVGGRKIVEDKQSSWRWLVSRELDGFPAQVVWQIGHQPWGVENHAFNELTQHYHLECQTTEVQVNCRHAAGGGAGRRNTPGLHRPKKSPEPAEDPKCGPWCGIAALFFLIVDAPTPAATMRGLIFVQHRKSKHAHAS
jgi:hypothetical protein